MPPSLSDTEEIVRSFPPPQHCGTFRPGLASYRYRPVTEHIDNWNETPPLTHVGYDVPWPQYDGYNSSSEQHLRRKLTRRDTANVTFPHYCARCGRPRSRQFQLKNPVEPGEVPYPGICNRCIPLVSPVADRARVPSRSAQTRWYDEETEEILVRRGGFKPDPSMLQQNEGQERSDIDRRIASHPSAWGHCRVVSADHYRDRRLSPRAEEIAEPPFTPEWYYQSVKRTIERDTPSHGRNGADKPRVRVPSRGALDQESISRPRGNPETRRYRYPDRSPAPPRKVKSFIDKQSPRRGILQQSRRDPPRDLYETEQEYHRRFHERSSDEEELRDARHRRVRFAPQRYNKRSRQQREEVRDWKEEKHDQRDFNQAKDRVHKSVEKGGGKFELYELDGHYSDENVAAGKFWKRIPLLYEENYGRARGGDIMTWLSWLKFAVFRFL